MILTANGSPGELVTTTRMKNVNLVYSVLKSATAAQNQGNTFSLDLHYSKIVPFRHCPLCSVYVKVQCDVVIRLSEYPTT